MDAANPNRHTHQVRYTTRFIGFNKRKPFNKGHIHVASPPAQPSLLRPQNTREAAPNLRLPPYRSSELIRFRAEERKGAQPPVSTEHESRGGARRARAPMRDIDQKLDKPNIDLLPESVYHWARPLLCTRAKRSALSAALPGPAAARQKPSAGQAGDAVLGLQAPRPTVTGLLWLCFALDRSADDGQERGREWMVCEAFQFILQKQASALLDLGVDPQFKDGVLLTFWRRYLQKSQQAYSKRKERARLVSDCSESDSAPGSALSGWSESDEADTELGSVSGCRSPSSAVSSDVASVCSGSLDGGQYRSKARRCGLLMSLPMTLAFCHLSLLWLREPLALADLLRFVAAGLIPYVNVYQILPEEMRLFGQDLHIFRTESIPSHKSVQKEAHRVAVFLDLPCFPPITEDCFLHPSVLCIKYLMEANLPDELHSWVRRVISHTGMGKEAFLTYDPLRKKTQPLNYDIQAAALIIVTLKLLFKLDDKMECDEAFSLFSLSPLTEKTSFSFRKWFKTVKQKLDEALEKEERDVARQSWKPYKPLYPSLKEKAVVLKRRRMVEHLQQHFQQLSGPPPDPPAPSCSSFVFSWEEDSAERPCFHRHRVDAVIRDWPDSSRVSNTKYWHTALKSCEPQ
ncbi:TAF1B polymerase, partial [Atractosteus spatula]|nr:TAF1B polymerase [Atractosteus spatula]